MKRRLATVEEILEMDKKHKSEMEPIIQKRIQQLTKFYPDYTSVIYELSTTQLQLEKAKDQMFSHARLENFRYRLLRAILLEPTFDEKTKRKILEVWDGKYFDATPILIALDNKGKEARTLASKQKRINKMSKDSFIAETYLNNQQYRELKDIKAAALMIANFGEAKVGALGPLRKAIGKLRNNNI